MHGHQRLTPAASIHGIILPPNKRLSYEWLTPNNSYNTVNHRSRNYQHEYNNSNPEWSATLVDARIPPSGYSIIRSSCSKDGQENFGAEPERAKLIGRAGGDWHPARLPCPLYACHGIGLLL